MDRLTVVVPCYNEVENLPDLIRLLNEAIVGNEFKIIVVDDNSPDGTGKTALKMKNVYDNIVLLERQNERGIGSAVLDGMRLAINEYKAEYIMTLDADLSHDPFDAPALLAAALNADLIQGSRYVRGGRIEGWPWTRRVISRVANALCRTLFRTGMREHTTYYRVYSRRLAQLIVGQRVVKGFEFALIPILVAKAHSFRVVEVPIVFRERQKGTSKLGVLDIVRWAIGVLRLFMDWRASSAPGIARKR
ncbi:MAG: polyprenol monophosphomannose synthase [Thermococcus sp.]|nr:polyprenol monophosphomannose synthase [Thermococcus sp.]